MMRATNLAVLLQIAITLAAVSIVLESCGNPSSASSTTEKATIQVDTVAYTQIVESPDSLSLYLNIDVKWGLALDTARADSLANWFSLSQFKIEDMWFPASGPACARPYNTFNFVFVRLEQPDTLIDTLGFMHYSSPPDPCFPTWTRYKFTWP